MAGSPTHRRHLHTATGPPSPPAVGAPGRWAPHLLRGAAETVGATGGRSQWGEAPTEEAGGATSIVAGAGEAIPGSAGEVDVEAAPSRTRGSEAKVEEGVVPSRTPASGGEEDGEEVLFIFKTMHAGLFSLQRSDDDAGVMLI